MRRNLRVGGVCAPCLAALLLTLSSPAAAHSSTTLAGGFAAGFSHPINGPDHLLAMVAVGLWGAVLGRPLLVLLPVIFPVVMAVGAIAAIVGVPRPPIELGIAVSVVVLGACIAGRVRPPVWAAGVIVGAFAIFHGFAHGLEIPSLADPVAYSAGFMLATGSLHVAGIALGAIDKTPRGATAIRVVGGSIAAVGAYFLYRALGA